MITHETHDGFVRRVLDAAGSPQLIGFGYLRPPEHATHAGRWPAMFAELDALGFVVFRAGSAVPSRRHVALWFERDDELETAAAAVRTLSLASPRAHLLLDLRSRAGGLETESSRLRPRTLSFARDRPQYSNASDLDQQLRRLVSSGQWHGARHVALASARRSREWPDRAAAVTAARVLIADGQLRWAEALLAGVAAEAACRCQTNIAESGYLELRFWQGRFAEAERHCASLPSSDPSRAAWSMLLQWASGAEQLDPRTPVPFDTFVLHPDHLVRAAPPPAEIVSPRCRSAPRGPSRAPLAVALSRWLAGDRDEVDRFIQRTGACGLRRWGLARSTMSVLHAVPALLNLLHESEDDEKTMVRGCAWMRRHSGADGVGICGGEGARLLAADGIGAVDLRASEVEQALRDPHPRTVVIGMVCLVTAPVRFAGQTIGVVVSKGRADLAETLTDAGAALASLLAGTLRSRLDAISAAGHAVGVAPEILGRSPAIGAVRQAIAQAAVATFAVLIEGESGTGKELVARALHRLGPRRDRRLCAVNCAALTDELIEAELFGYARGAFTGAIGARVGLFEEAHHGTLFLDEVGELTPRAQAKLLRTLQEREIRRLGENTPRPVDVRVIAATNVALQDAAALGRFREDLLFRLAVIRIRVPALRERVEDVPLLALSFWRQLTRDSATRAVLAPDALSALCRHRWPGNVRELQNAIAALVVAAPPRGRVHARHVAAVLAASSGAGAAPASLESAIRGFERSVVAAALARNGGRRTRAAAELGLTRQGLTKAIRRLGLSTDIGKIA